MQSTARVPRQVPLDTSEDKDFSVSKTEPPIVIPTGHNSIIVTGVSSRYRSRDQRIAQPRIWIYLHGTIESVPYILPCYVVPCLSPCTLRDVCSPSLRTTGVYLIVKCAAHTPSAFCLFAVLHLFASHVRVLRWRALVR